MTTCLICSLPIAIPPANVCPGCTADVQTELAAAHAAKPAPLARYTGDVCVKCGELLKREDSLGTSSNTCLECQREEFREWRNLTLMENLRNFPAVPPLAEPVLSANNGECAGTKREMSVEGCRDDRTTLAAAGSFNPEP